MKTIKIGIASQKKIRERVLAIAKGELKPKASDPKIWFTSIDSLTRTLKNKSVQVKRVSMFYKGTRKEIEPPL